MSIGSKTFPEGLYNLLQFVHDNEREHVISWVCNGSAIKVHDKEEFERELLPMYFNTTKYNSFTRALHAHGFICEKKGRRTGIYSHPNFNRDNSCAPWLIKRAKTKRNPKAANSKNRASRITSETSLNKLLSSCDHGSRGDAKLQQHFPSLLDTRTQSDTDDQVSLFDQLHQTVRSHISHQTSNAPVMPPVQRHVSQSTDNNDMEPSTPQCSLTLAALSRRSDVGDQQEDSKSAIAVLELSSGMVTGHQARDEKHIDHNYGTLLDDQIEPIAFKTDPQILTKYLRLADVHFGSGVFPSSLEPRSIQEMTERPDDSCFCS